MALRYAEAKAALDSVAQDLKARLDGLRNVKALAAREEQLAQGLATKYSGVASQINTVAAANPADEEWQSIKAVKDKLAAEFSEVSTLASAMKTATDGVVVD